MIRTLNFAIFASLLVLILASCQRKLYPAQFYKNLEQADFSSNQELFQYNPLIVSAGDQLKISIFANSGEQLITPSGITEGANATKDISVLVDDSGFVNLPKVGRLKVSGNTIHQVSIVVADAYAAFINQPFVQTEWSGKNVFVFSGSNAAGRRVGIVGDRLTLVDAMAQAGGISESNASKIDLIRKNGNQVKIYRIDLSDKSNVLYSYIPLKDNDIIYAYPAKRPVKKIVDELLPYMTLVTTGLLIYNLFR